MATFVYEAKKGPAELVKGKLVAENRHAAVQKLAQMGYVPVSVEGEETAFSSASRKGPGIFNTIRLQDLTDFTRKLSDLLESGLTITKSLRIIADQVENKALKAMILDILDYCVAGHALSEALGRYPRAFSGLYVSMVRSGEAGGALEDILKRLADFNEKQLESRTKIRAALAYPVLMAVVGFVTIIILMTFVIPRMMVMFSDMAQALPLPTLILLGASDLMRNYWWLLAIGAVAAFLAWRGAYASVEGKAAIDRARLALPLVGRFETKAEIARFSRTLATLLHNGVPMLEALSVVSATVENAAIRHELAKAYAAVQDGSSLAKGLALCPSVPPAVISMVMVGEEGGNLERSLFKVAEGYERETDQMIKVMMSLLEPVMILILGCVVGFIVISMLLPIFEINFLVR